MIKAIFLEVVENKVLFSQYIKTKSLVKKLTLVSYFRVYIQRQ